MTLNQFFDFLNLNFELTTFVSIHGNKSEYSVKRFFQKVILNSNFFPDRGRELEEFERNPNSLKEIFKDALDYEVIEYAIQSNSDVMESIFNPNTTYIRSNSWSLWIKIKK